MNRSQSAAAAMIARAEAEPRPRAANFAVCLWCAKMQMREYDRRAALCGAQWTAAQLRFVTRQLEACINGEPIPENAFLVTMKRYDFEAARNAEPCELNAAIAAATV